MQKEPVVGLPEEPVAKITHFGWAGDLNKLMLSRTTVDDYENHCNVDVLVVQNVEELHEDIEDKQLLRQSAAVKA